MAQASHLTSYYQEVEVKTADPFELVILLYQGAIRNLNKAKSHLNRGEIEPRVQAINKAMAIIGELQAVLDFEKGKEIATSLDRLYTYMLNRLTEANVNRDTQRLEEVIKLLQTLKSGWEEARQQLRPATAASGPNRPFQAFAG